MNRNIIIDYLDDLLKPYNYEDSTYNGLQFYGKEEIKVICFAVNPSLYVIKNAKKYNCDLLITHHGMFWVGIKNINRNLKEKLRLLIENDINLYTSHLPLDFNQDFGNNVEIAKILELNQIGSNKFGILVNYNNTFSELKKLIRDRINYNSRFYINDSNFNNILILTGLFNHKVIENLKEKENIKTIITGETSSDSIVLNYAKENGINIILSGHYETEIFGIKALMRIMNDYFKDELECYFIEENDVKYCTC